MTQSKSRTYQRKRDRRHYRLRYFVRTPGGLTSKIYVDVLACRRQLRRLEKGWPGSALVRMREFLDEKGNVEEREHEVQRNGRWVAEETTTA